MWVCRGYTSASVLAVKVYERAPRKRFGVQGATDTCVLTLSGELLQLHGRCRCRPLSPMHPTALVRCCGAVA